MPRVVIIAPSAAEEHQRHRDSFVVVYRRAPVITVSGIGVVWIIARLNITWRITWLYIVRLRIALRINWLYVARLHITVIGRSGRQIASDERQKYR